MTKKNEEEKKELKSQIVANVHLFLDDINTNHTGPLANQFTSQVRA